MSIEVGILEFFSHEVYQNLVQDFLLSSLIGASPLGHMDPGAVLHASFQAFFFCFGSE